MNKNLGSYAPIRTKLNPPHYLQEAMPRPRLLHLTRELSHLKILSIVAPPGYGKSTLLSQIYQQLLRKEPLAHCAWLNLDSDDNDAVTMTEYLCAAFYQFDANIANRSLQILKSGALRSLQEIYIALIEDLSQSQSKFFLFIDDFHLLQKGESLKFYQWFLDHLPPNVSLVIASRKALPFQLKRLKLNQQYETLNAQDLQFNELEIRDFFIKHQHKNISEHLLKIIAEKTEGWIGALQMLSLSLERSHDTESLVKNFSGEHKDIMEYLSEAVLEQLPVALKNFILKISILDRVCAALAIPLTGENQAQEYLEEIERRHLFFIPLDNEKRWYRFHHLFQEFIVRQALKILGESTVHEKYRSASIWFEQENYHHEAIQYALNGKDYARAAELIAAFAILLFQNQGDHRTMFHWMKQLPEKYLQIFPIIRMSYAISLAFTNHFREAQVELDRLKVQINGLSDPEIINQLMPMVEMGELMIESFQDRIVSGRQQSLAWLEKWPQSPTMNQGMIYNILGVSFFFTSFFEKGLEYLEKAAHLFRANQAYYAYMWPLCGRVGLHWAHGKLNKALELHRELVLTINKYHGKNFHMEKIMEVGISEVYYEKADFAEALRLIKDNKIYIYTFSGTDPNIVYYNVLVRTCLLNQQFAQAEEHLREGEKWSKELEYLRFQDHMFWLKIELYLQTHRILEAKRLLQERGWAQPEDFCDEIEDTNAMLKNIFARFAVTRVLMTEGQYKQAAAKLNPLIVLLKRIDLMRYLLSAMIQELLCQAALGQQELALQKLREVLELAAKDGFVSVFLEQGSKHNQSLYALLKKTDGLSTESLKLRNRILRELEKYFEQSKKDHDCGLQLLDKISTRELEILSALESAKNNAQVAKSLHISPGTLKWHLHNIYQKLDVKNRSGAVVKAKQLELI